MGLSMGYLSDVEFKSYLEELACRHADPVAGFFGPESLVWQVSSEAVTNLSMIRAALMQIAHPKIAQGVADFSQFRRQPLQRFLNTHRTANDLVFGDTQTAINAASRLYTIHARVSSNGHVSDPRLSYSASEPQLMLWVYATLVDSAILGRRAFLPDLSRQQWEQCYQESKMLAQLFGIDEQALPKTLTDLQDWVQVMLGSEEITVSPTSRLLARSLLSARWYSWLAAPYIYVLAAGFLPPRLREAYGFKWNPPVKAAFWSYVNLARSTCRILPRSLRIEPAARRAENRLRRQTARRSQPRL
jgi:uncharacterized protein (DUF2236 family)